MTTWHLETGGLDRHETGNLLLGRVASQQNKENRFFGQWQKKMGQEKVNRWFIKGVVA